jgi:hypothetical protein
MDSDGDPDTARFRFAETLLAEPELQVMLMLQGSSKRVQRICGYEFLAAI